MEMAPPRSLGIEPVSISVFSIPDSLLLHDQS